jgi:hypothetical protein
MGAWEYGSMGVGMKIIIKDIKYSTDMRSDKDM